MMTFKELHDTMTDTAMSIESVMRGHHWISLDEIAVACSISHTSAEFLLAEMSHFEIVHQDVWGRYSLTPAYRTYPMV